ncbi:capsular biosynthesis protein [Arthrobacter psychrolactophilus]|uniref:Capsular biosynthesis protein n=1 Tax=Arthrobacter psychrolactophilus TaxID=92442 RepID=A0A2V5ITR0_9MICC|nr:capsular biosynthesis protein [Arthrobacter psychrolactophilus]
MTQGATLSVREGMSFLLNSPVHQGDMDAALITIAELARDSEAHLVVTANIDHIVDLDLGNPLTSAYERASLRVIDGMPVVWALRALGAKNIHRVTGADLIESVSAASARNNWRVAITGGNDEILAKAADNLQRKYPNASIKAVPMPMLSSAEDPRGREAILLLEDFDPDVVFLCLGAPKQESWFLHWKDVLPAAVYIGAGAAVDFAAEAKKRAPIAAQRAGLEWVWRLSQEFRRLAPRYLFKGPRFLSIVATSMTNHRRRTVTLER